MELEPMRVAALCSLGLVVTLSANTLAAQPPALTVQSTGSQQMLLERSRRPRASLRLELEKTEAFVGQAIPITVTASFRDVAAVTLDGPPRLTVKGVVVTSDLPPEPQQTHELIDGVPSLIATWKGSVTAASPGAMSLSVDLPVRIQYREPDSQTLNLGDPIGDLFQADPLAGMAVDPLGSRIFSQMRQRMQQMMERMTDHLSEQTLVLKSSARTLQALALPSADQPSTFSGAVGRFEVSASLPSARIRVAEPVVLQIVVEGNGDLDRVDLPGVATSATWKTYAPKAIDDTSTPQAQRKHRKIFEQLLIASHAGELTVPAVSFTAFDPIGKQYVTRSTSALTVSVDAASAAAEGSAERASSEHARTRPVPASATSTAKRIDVRSFVRLLVPSRRYFGAGLGLVLLIVLATAIRRVSRRTATRRTLRRRMRRAASEGSVAVFFDSAHQLIRACLAARWHIDPEQVTARAIRERLGDDGEPLAATIATDQALRFGRARVDPGDLPIVCASVERSL